MAGDVNAIELFDRFLIQKIEYEMRIWSSEERKIWRKDIHRVKLAPLRHRRNVVVVGWIKFFIAVELRWS